MFRSDRVCAVMFSQQGGPGRNHNKYMRQLLLFQKVESDGGPFFKVVPEC